MTNLLNLAAHFVDTYSMEILHVKSIIYAMLEGVIMLLLSVFALSIIVATLAFTVWVVKHLLGTMAYLKKIYLQKLKN